MNEIIKDLFKDVSLVVCKVTKSCNLSCRYCPNNPEKINANKIMEIDTFKNAFDLIISNSTHYEISWMFHGGEPFLLKLDWYEECLEYMRKSLEKYKKHVKIIFQTNLTLLNTDILNFIKNNDIEIGFSLDGSPEINDLSRQKGQIITNNIKKIHKYAGPRTIINKDNIAHILEICKFYDAEGLRSPIFNPCYHIYGFSLMDMSVSAEDFFCAKKTILKYMIKRNAEFIDINLKNKIYRFFAPSKTPIYHCDSFYCGATRTITSIDPYGNIYPCGRFVDWENKNYILVNSNKSEKIDFYRLQKIRSEIFSKGLEYEDCLYCNAFNICTYGCPAFSNKNGKLGVFDEFNCKYSKLLFRYFKENQYLINILYAQLKEKEKKLK